MGTHRVAVILSEEEMGKVRAAAGVVPLSAWFRALGMAEVARREQAERDQKMVSEAVKHGVVRGLPDVAKMTREPERRETRRGKSTVDRISDVAHAAVRKNLGLCKHGARPDLCRYEECRGH